MGADNTGDEEEPPGSSASRSAKLDGWMCSIALRSITEELVTPFDSEAVHVGRKREDAFTVETRRRGVHLPVRMGFQRDGGVGERGMQRIGDFEHHLAARRRLRAGRARKPKHAENECQAM